MNIKRIIAREGLIIIAISLSFAIVSYLNSREKNKKYDFEQRASIAEITEVKKVFADSEEQYQKLKAAGFSDKEIIKHYLNEGAGEAIATSQSTGLYIMLQKPTDLLRIDGILKKDFPKLTHPSFIEWENQSRSVAITRYYDNHGNTINFRNYDFILVVLILLYPAYWTVRFIIWALKTLKQ